MIHFEGRCQAFATPQRLHVTILPPTGDKECLWALTWALGQDATSSAGRIKSQSGTLWPSRNKFKVIDTVGCHQNHVSFM